MNQVILAVDPGRAGAACLMHCGRVAGAWSWRPYPKAKPRQWYVTDVHGDESVCYSLHEVGESIAAWAFDLGFNEWTLAVEQLFAGRNWKTALSLGESAALVYGPCTRDACNALAIVRPHPGQWRPAVLGCPGNASSETSERLAMQLCRARWPELASLLGNGHAVEATCQAWHVTTQQRREAARGE